MEGETVSRYIFEGEMARMERMVVRLALSFLLDHHLFLNLHYFSIRQQRSVDDRVEFL